jgi:hypothetical protein
MAGRNKIQIKIMKSRIIILAVVLLLIPLFIGATPLNLTVKMGGGCPFKPGPMFERCNPTIIHSTISLDNLANLSLPLVPLSSALPVLPKVGAVGPTAAFFLDALTALPLRC